MGLLVLVAGMVPVIPATMSDHVIKISVGIDDSGVPAHGPTHVRGARTRNPAPYKRKACFLVWRVPIMGRNGPESGRY